MSHLRSRQVIFALIATSFALTLAACGSGVSTTPPRTPETVRLLTWDLDPWTDIKAADPDILTVATQVIARSELAMIQGIQDVDGSAAQDLLDSLNAAGTGSWSLTAGARVGAGTLEQYALFYRSDLFTVTRQVEFTAGAEPTGDSFLREPLMLRVKHNGSGTEFGLVFFKAAPADAATELDALPAALAYAETQLGTSRLLLGGNFFADCAYLNDAGYNALSLVSGSGASGWTWLTSRTQDTTVSTGTDCGYTHLVSHGAMTSENVAGTGAPLDVMSVFGLIEADAAAVSPHLPVKLGLRF